VAQFINTSMLLDAESPQAHQLRKFFSADVPLLHPPA